MASCVSLQILQPLAWESNQPPAQGEASLSPCPSPPLSVQSSCPQHPGGQPVLALVLREEGGGERAEGIMGRWEHSWIGVQKEDRGLLKPSCPQKAPDGDLWRGFQVRQSLSYRDALTRLKKDEDFHLYRNHTGEYHEVEFLFKSFD